MVYCIKYTLAILIPFRSFAFYKIFQVKEMILLSIKLNSFNYEFIVHNVTLSVESVTLHKK